MLKIKENKLDYLLNYGFKKQKLLDYTKIRDIDIYRNDEYDINIFVSQEQLDVADFRDNLLAGVLYMMNDDSSYQEFTVCEFPDVLYDLIKDGIVEKEEE